ncbi:MAG: hypothetical protein KF705_03900 [Phycisphaeraceae bacterium]|nr:hypothetical protein [Phycisphaeraceae bacterium]
MSEADDAFQKIAPEWPSHRMAPVDRAILRLAHYEMTATETHPRIVINEAVGWPSRSVPEGRRVR